MNGLINGNSAAVSTTGAVGIDMVQSVGFNFTTILSGIVIWIACKVLDMAYAKITKK